MTEKVMKISKWMMELSLKKILKKLNQEMKVKITKVLEMKEKTITLECKAEETMLEVMAFLLEDSCSSNSINPNSLKEIKDSKGEVKDINLKKIRRM